MINITAGAAEKVKGILEQDQKLPADGGLRIYVQAGGCSGLAYGMALDQASDADQVFEVQGIKVIIDPTSLQYLEGAEVDYKSGPMGEGFAINNPNAPSGGGCGQSCCGDGSPPRH
jgi:iron-sulfur cluster assembly protein